MAVPWFRRRPPEPPREPVPGPFVVEAIGHVCNAVSRPRPHGWEKVESVVRVLPAHAPKLAGVERYSHVIVLFVMDLAAEAPEKPETITLASGNTYGILATRSQLRPNHIGVAAVPLLRRDGLELTVRGLDAIDGTAVIDNKPYLPAYDAHPGAQIPPAQV
jgi:tRNA-Thr(GGU) m(6)t(6)A37 methyltransferase TsaA